MTWQDELIELETRLASGALSAEEYRRARDELLAQSQSSPQAAAEPQEPAEQPGSQYGPSQSGPSQSGPSPSGPSHSGPSQSGQSQPGPSPSAQPPQYQEPSQPQYQPPPEFGGPFPPPFQWGSQQQPQQSPQQSQPQQSPQSQSPQQRQGMDSTQVMRAVGQEPERPVERTEVVRPGQQNQQQSQQSQQQAGPPTQQMQPEPERTQAVSDPDRTQTVSGLNRPRPSHGRDRLNEDATPTWGRRNEPRTGQQNQQSAQSSQGQSDDESPWGDSPVVAPSNTWMKQGPESFEQEEPVKRGRMVGAVIAGVMVLALVVVAVIYFSNTSTNTDDRAKPQNTKPPLTQTTTSKPPPPLPEPPPPSSPPRSDSSALVKPMGKTRGGGGPFKASELKARELFQPDMVAALMNAGFTKGVLKTTTVKSTTIALYSLSVRSESGAKQVADTYADDQINGDIAATRDGAQQGVRVFANDESDGTHFRRAVYVLGARVVIVDVSDNDVDTARSVFDTLLAKQVQHQPPTVRDPK